MKKNESADLINLFYTLPILDAIGIKEMAEETNNDPTLKDLRDIIRSEKLFISNDKPHLAPYKQIISEITVLNNGTLLKQGKIILPHSLREKVIRLTHNGSHPRQNALKRRFIRFFPNLKSLKNIVFSEIMSFYHLPIYIYYGYYCFSIIIIIISIFVIFIVNIIVLFL